jgi:ribosomal protein L7/L12
MAKPKKPYDDKRTDAITLPKEVEEELRQLVARGRRFEAMQRVLKLTGAGLKRSKDYVDNL